MDINSILQDFSFLKDLPETRVKYERRLAKIKTAHQENCRYAPLNKSMSRWICEDGINVKMAQSEEAIISFEPFCVISEWVVPTALVVGFYFCEKLDNNYISFKDNNPEHLHFSNLFWSKTNLHPEQNIISDYVNMKKTGRKKFFLPVGNQFFDFIKTMGAPIEMVLQNFVTFVFSWTSIIYCLKIKNRVYIGYGSAIDVFSNDMVIFLMKEINWIRNYIIKNGRSEVEFEIIGAANTKEKIRKALTFHMNQYNKKGFEVTNIDWVSGAIDREITITLGADKYLAFNRKLKKAGRQPLEKEIVEFLKKLSKEL